MLEYYLFMSLVNDLGLRRGCLLPTTDSRLNLPDFQHRPHLLCHPILETRIVNTRW
jgi:hypothetical protein